MFGFPGPDRGRPRQRAGALPRCDGDPDPDGQRLPGAGAAVEMLRPGFAAVGRGRARHLRPARQLPVCLYGEILRRHGLSRPCQLHRQLQPRAGAVRGCAAARLDGAQLLLQHRVRGRPGCLRQSVVAAGRLCAASGAHRPGLRLVRLSGRYRRCQRLEPDRHPCAGLPARERVFQSGGLSHDSRRRSEAHEGNRLPQPVRRAHPQLHRIQRLLAGQQLHQPRRAGRILGLPRTGRHHGPVAAAQVRGPGARCRAPVAMDADPEHPTTGDRPGRLLRHVLRDRRHGRRRHRLPARRRQFPLDRRLRLWRRMDARAGGETGPQCLGPVVDGPAPQRRRPGPEKPRHPQGGRVDAAGPAVDGRNGLVPLRRRPDRRSRRHPGRRLPHRVYRRTGL